MGEEVNMIAGFGSIILAHPLQFSHDPGTEVVMLDAETPLCPCKSVASGMIEAPAINNTNTTTSLTTTQCPTCFCDSTTTTSSTNTSTTTSTTTTFPQCFRDSVCPKADGTDPFRGSWRNACEDMR